MSHSPSLSLSQSSNQAIADSDDGQTLLPYASTLVADTMTLEIPANLQYVNTLGTATCAFLANVKRLAEPEVTLYNLELAICEIGTNIVNHAYTNRCGRIRMAVTLSYQPLRITIILYDTGISFEPATVPQPCLGEAQEHGYGLFLVNQLMDEVAYHQTAAGNTWTLVKNLPVADLLD